MQSRLDDLLACLNGSASEETRAAVSEQLDDPASDLSGWVAALAELATLHLPSPQRRVDWENLDDDERRLKRGAKNSRSEARMGRVRQPDPLFKPIMRDYLAWVRGHGRGGPMKRLKKALSHPESDFRVVLSRLANAPGLKPLVTSDLPSHDKNACIEQAVYDLMLRGRTKAEVASILSLSLYKVDDLCWLMEARPYHNEEELAQLLEERRKQRSGATRNSNS
mgnify:CR=1 FL=1